MTYEEELYSEEKIIERLQQLEQLLHRVGPIARKRLRIRVKYSNVGRLLVFYPEVSVRI